MATSYTSLLGLALPVTGELAGTWGDVVNNSITSLLDTAVAGTTTLSTDADVTLTTTTGSSNQARQMILLCSGARTAVRTITAPAQSKVYVIVNKTTGGYGVKIVGAGPTTGLTVANGSTTVVAWNGSDFVEIAPSTVTNLAGGAAGSVPYQSGANATTFLSLGTAAQVLQVNAGATAPEWVSSTGTGNVVRATSPTLASPLISNLTSGRVTYATTSGQLTDSANLLYSGTDLTVYGVTVGRGGGAISTNTALGASTLRQANTGTNNTGVGYRSLGYTNVVTGSHNVGVGYASQFTLTSGTYNTTIGNYSLQTNTTGSYNTGCGGYALSQATGSYNTGCGGYALSQATGDNNTAVGYFAGYSSPASTGTNNTSVGYYAGYQYSSGSNNTIVGQQAGYNATSGSSNTFVGSLSGSAITTGGKNSILGAYSGNQDGLDIRTASNYAVISDGDGNRLLSMYNGGTLALDGGAVPNAGTGITFPATQSASSDANTLDDYEEGTWTPALGGTTTYTTQSGAYTKIGNTVIASFEITINALGTGSNDRITGLPFTSANIITASLYYFASLPSSVVQLTFGNNSASTTAFAYGATAAAATLSPIACWQNGTIIRGVFIYRV